MMASYVLRAAAQGYLAFAFTNTGPKILSHNGTYDRRFVFFNPSREAM
jgi:LDH2 family malate/lactate/ureidoglycolate dehydrogenase